MFLVVFRNRKRADIDQEAYDRDDERMEKLASQQPGYIWFKSFTAEDDEVVSISAWEDEAAARNWGRHDEHVEVQKRGRREYYDCYDIFACDVVREHRFNAKDKA
jgi:heme-degrading monooxygenase HmoA